MAFHQQQYIPFQYVDGAGVLFFGRAAEIFHETYEKWLMASGEEWKAIFMSKKYAIPIKNFQVDFMKPVLAGHTFTARIGASKIGTTSFETSFDLVDSEGHVYFKIKATHVFLDIQAERPMPIPAGWRAYFSEHLL